MEKDKKCIYVYTNNNGIIRKIYGSLTGKYKVGDKVEMVNNGASYTSYDAMANAMKIPEGKWKRMIVENGSIGIIFSRKIHDRNSVIVYGVNFDDNYYIVGEKGLKLAIMVDNFNDEDFEL